MPEKHKNLCYLCMPKHVHIICICYLLRSPLAQEWTRKPLDTTITTTLRKTSGKAQSIVCAPPLRRSSADLDSVWQSINNKTITVISSDHAPSLYNSERGKRKPILEASKAEGGVPMFKDIPNGLPGIETRLPLLFHAAQKGRITFPRFVELCCTNPAKIYGLDGIKGSIAPGYDADLVIWYPQGHQNAETAIKNEMLHHSIDYTPFEGMQVGNWPRYVLLKGQVKWDREKELAEGHMKGVTGQPGDGVFLKRKTGMVLVGKMGQVVAGMKAGERELWLR